ncbi:MAG: hypothetical protein ABR949_15380 [Candidatus Aquilonibacter sp.]|jgi:hypothetical protein
MAAKAKSTEKPTNTTLPLLEFQKLERLAVDAEWSVAAFSRMLLRFALPRWREAWNELGDQVETKEKAEG